MIKEIIISIEENSKKNKSDKEKFQCALDSIEAMISYTDIDGRIYYLNSAFADFLGDTKDNIIGKKEDEFLNQEIAKLCEKNNKLVCESGFLKRVDVVGGKAFETFKSKVSFSEDENKDIKIFTLIELKDC